jgi:hypothetical protein
VQLEDGTFGYVYGDYLTSNLGVDQVWSVDVGAQLLVVRAKAEQGEMRAQYELGHRYLHGISVEG